MCLSEYVYVCWGAVFVGHFDSGRSWEELWVSFGKRCGGLDGLEPRNDDSSLTL